MFFLAKIERQETNTVELAYNRPDGTVNINPL